MGKLCNNILHEAGQPQIQRTKRMNIYLRRTFRMFSFVVCRDPR